MPQKICNECGKRPCKVSNSGKVLGKCDECQKAYWREQKALKSGYGNVVDKPLVRRCKECRTTKPVEKFERWGMGYRSVCTDCKAPKSEPTPKATPKPTPKAQPKQDGSHILIVNGNQVVLAQVISEKASAKNPSLLVNFYEAQGYSIQHVFESEVPNVSH